MTATNSRQCLQQIRPMATTHPGMWLDRYLQNHDAKSALIKEVAAIETPEVYRKFFERWTVSLEQHGNVITKKANVQGRLSIGLGAESVIETAISLHHTYGVPYIPGSALKGLAARYARKHLNPNDWGEASANYRIMFGDTQAAGYVTFFDALYVPGTGHKHRPLCPDIITVHHPKYYQGNEPPADWDSPTPIPFLSATGQYLLAIAGETTWVEAAYNILFYALAEEGIGAKTSSGYGRMTIEGMEQDPPGQTQSAAGQPIASAPTREARRGVIVDIQPSKRRGRVKDQESGKEYNFETSVILGDFPSKKTPVIFDLESGKVIKVQRK